MGRSVKLLIGAGGRDVRVEANRPAALRLQTQKPALYSFSGGTSRIEKWWYSTRYGYRDSHKRRKLSGEEKQKGAMEFGLQLPLPQGRRMTTLGCWDVPFQEVKAVTLQTIAKGCKTPSRMNNRCAAMKNQLY